MSIVPCRRAEGTPYSSVNEQICTVPVYRWRPRSSSDLSFCSSLSYLSLSFSGSRPSNSWHNPVECIMSTLNLGIQSVGLMRKLRVSLLKKVQHVAILWQIYAKLVIEVRVLYRSSWFSGPSKGLAQSSTSAIEVEGEKCWNGCSCITVRPWWHMAIAFCCF